MEERTAAAAQSETPSDRYGALFDLVQRRGLFADSKTFADAVPRFDVASTLRAFADLKDRGDDALRCFVADHFILPDEDERAVPPATMPLRQHIAATWHALTRPPVAVDGSALAVAHPHVVPGGRFRELYYWDSYFTMLGLARDRPDMVEAMLDIFTDLIERHGHIPNGTRTYYLGRSQPPFFTLMIALSPAGLTQRRRAAAMTEYRFWMDGARAVTLGDDAVLNRYWDDRDGPRDESWREDVELAEASDRDHRELWRDLRAGCESGWDFSSRWLGDGRALATIRATRIVPADLNAILFAVETALGLEAEAAARRAAIDRHLWLPSEDRYADLDLDRGRTSHVSAATLAPLFAGCASAEQAAAVAALTERTLLAPGGLRTTSNETGQQWDAPNGWAPLQWIAIAGLRGYGHNALAQRIADAWLTTVERHFAATGQLLEKYDVERGTAGGGGEYAVQTGFGWTNGVTAALLDERA